MLLNFGYLDSVVVASDSWFETLGTQKERNISLEGRLIMNKHKQMQAGSDDAFISDLSNYNNLL